MGSSDRMLTIAMRFLIGFGATVLIVGQIRGKSTISNYFALKNSEKTMQQTVQALDEENKHLADEITRLKKSPSYARKVLRDKYHVTDPDENIVFFAE